MPNVGSLVRLSDDGIAIVTRISPDGKDDRIQRFGTPTEERTTAYAIKEVLHEPVPE